ncbi:MAG: DUF402 domain-containing protein [bacterium]
MQPSPWSFAAHLAEVVEVKRRPDGTSVRFFCRLVERGPGTAVLLYVLAEPWTVADLRLPAGSATFAYYWTTRWYNVYHWLAPSGATLGHYVNVATPARLSPDEVEWLDLGVDVLAVPGTAPRVLDEDELRRLPAPLQLAARRSLDRVLRRWPLLVDAVERRTRRLLGRFTRGAPAPPG